MPLERVRIQAVRCLSWADVELDPRRNLLWGPNGAGKTSFLESLHLLGRGRSFRTRRTERLLQFGAQRLTVSGEVTLGGLRRQLRVSFGGGRLDAQKDGAAASLIELAQTLPVQVIDPQRHALIEAGPSVRRRYLDAGVFHVEPAYLADWRGYRRVLAQRNSALQAAAHGAPLGVWSAALAASGAAVHERRERYALALAEQARLIGKRLLGREVSVDYRPGWRRGLDLAAALDEATERDRAAGYTQVGPHRADLMLGLDGAPVRDMASRGQQKLVAATLVLAHMAVQSAATDSGGLVLVDDPVAELDSASLERLMAELARLDVQQVVTGLVRNGLHASPGDRVFHVEQGTIERML